MAAEGAREATHPALHALRFYRKGFRLAPDLPLYECLLDAVVTDVEAGGLCAELLADPGPDPIEDAVPLRLLGAVHRFVLAGQADDLAPYFPSVGGEFQPEAGTEVQAALLATLEEHRAEVEQRLRRPVQTNEVGRCRALLVGFLEVASTAGLPLRVLEIGSSAGLNLRWDRYRYDGGADGTGFGPVNSAVRLTGGYHSPGPRLDRLAMVADRRGCDASPLDPTSREDQLTLKSFVWPEQAERLARLDAALSVAQRVAAPVDRADAGEWVEAHVADDAEAEGTATVVFHSLVWQYLTARTRGRLLAVFHRAGRAASERAPLAWLRMEPAGGKVGAEDADVWLTMWPGGRERRVARAGYHGQWVEALAE
jgi:hypothetical protein